MDDNIAQLISGPSQLIAEVQKATPQAPVYATIRPPHTSQNRPSSSNMRSSLNSLPSALNSTPLVKSVAFTEDPPRFHPTNPFYTTLPSNYSSASKLPIPNGKPANSLDRNKKETHFSDNSPDLKSPSFFTNTNECPRSLQYYQNSENINGYESEKSTGTHNANLFSNDNYSLNDNQSLPNNINSNNPFETKRNSDPFEKYLRQETVNGKHENETTLPASQSDNNFHGSEEIIKHSITEHKISEVEEVKTIKKMVLNGSGDTTDYQQHTNVSSPHNHDINYAPQESRYKEFKSYQSSTNRGHIIPTDYQKHIGSQNSSDMSHKPEKSRYKEFKDLQSSSFRDQVIPTPTQYKNDFISSSLDKKEDSYNNSGTLTYHQYKPYQPREYDITPTGKLFVF